VTPSTKRCSSIFDLRPLTPKIDSTKFDKNSPITRLVWKIDRRCLRLIGGFRKWPIRWNHVQCCEADSCCYGNNIWANLGYFSKKSPMSRLVCQIDQICLGLPAETTSGPTFVAKAMTSETGAESNRLPACMSVCLYVRMYVCNAPSNRIQIDSSSFFLDGIEPFLGHQFSMTKTTKRCSSNFDLLPWQQNLGYFCKNFKLLLFCFSMETSHFRPLVLRDPLYKTLFFDFYARQHICYSAYMPRQFSLSVCLSVCPSVRHTRVLCQNG